MDIFFIYKRKIKLALGSTKIQVAQRIIKKHIYTALGIFVFFNLFPVLENKALHVNSGEVLGAYSETQQNSDLIEKKSMQVNAATAPKLSAKAVLVFNRDTGENIFETNSEQKLPIASLTKLMTAIVASQSEEFVNPVVISEKDKILISPYLNLRIGDRVRPEDLREAMLVGSANDAALTLANHFPNKESFVAEMNKKAAELGMTDTSFSNPIGFDAAGNYSTAKDLKKLVSYALEKLPFSNFWNKPSFSFVSNSNIKYYIKNTNNLIQNYDNVYSIKTGSTPLSMESMIVEADTDEGRVIVIVIGSEDREKDTLAILNYIFENFSEEL